MTYISRIVNLCPHPIAFVNKKGEVVLTLPECKTPARATYSYPITNDQIWYLGTPDQYTNENPEPVNIPTRQRKLTGVAYLPDPEEGTVYVVSYLVLHALHGSRPDCWSPAQKVRAGKEVLACSELSQELF